MRWPKSQQAAALLLVAGALAAANVWFAAARSTIPLELDNPIAGKDVRHEKHPPKDNVYLLDLRSRGLIQVDGRVFDRVATHDRLRKTRWSRLLVVNETPVELEFSADVFGLIRAMPLACLILLVTAAVACSISRRNPDFCP